MWKDGWRGDRSRGDCLKRVWIKVNTSPLVVLRGRVYNMLRYFGLGN